MSADTDVVREALGFADQPWHREALAALARLEAAEQQRDGLADALEKAVETLVDLEEALYLMRHPVVAAACAIAINASREALGEAGVDPRRAPTEGRAR